jgi:hypothetical protein
MVSEVPLVPGRGGLPRGALIVAMELGQVGVFGRVGDRAVAFEIRLAAGFFTATWI